MTETEQTRTDTNDDAHIVTIDEVLAQHPNTSPIPVVPQLSVALGLLIFVFSVTYLGMHTLSEKNTQVDNNVRVETPLPADTHQALISSSSFDTVTLQAQSAIVWDVQSQRVIFNKNADDVRPLASITKLMTALIAYDLLDPESTVNIPLQALETEGDSGFSDGEKFTTQNLIDLTLISSSNDGAAALATAAGSVIKEGSRDADVFIHAMNVKAETLGLDSTTFKNMTGLDVSAQEAGAYGSARDMALLMEHIVIKRPEIVARTNVTETAIKNKSGAYHTVENTNDVVNRINGLIASKTGYTPLAGGNLVVAFNAGLSRPIVIVVLGSTHAGRFEDTLALVEQTRTFLSSESE
jgi:D-alanyl-D-alanine carboxypeptidase